MSIMDYNQSDNTRLSYKNATHSPPDHHHHPVGKNAKRTGAVTVAGNYNAPAPNNYQQQFPEHPAIKGLQSLRRNSIQRKIFEQQLRQAETTQSVNQAINQARPITHGHHLAAPAMPLRKLSTSTPNLTVISESEQLLGPPQSYGMPRSPMRADHSHSPRSPRVSPYPLSPASSSLHLADHGGNGEPDEQFSRMRLSSPVPPSYMNGGGSPIQPSYLAGYAQNQQQIIAHQQIQQQQQNQRQAQQHQAQQNQQYPQQQLLNNGGLPNCSNGYLHNQQYSLNNRFQCQISPASPAVQIVPSQPQEQDGLERELSHLLNDMFGSKQVPTSSASANLTLLTSQAALINKSQTPFMFGRTLVSPSFNIPTPSAAAFKQNQNQMYHHPPPPLMQRGPANPVNDTLTNSNATYHYPAYHGDSYQPTMKSYSSGIGSLSSKLMSPIPDIVMTPDGDYGIQFPLPDDEVSTYNYEVPASSTMDWSENGTPIFHVNPQPNGSATHTPYGTPPNGRTLGTMTPPYVLSMNDLKPQDQLQYRARVASMPSLSLRTTERNQAALCGGVVVDRAVKKPLVEPIPTTVFASIPVPTITITDNGSDQEEFNYYPSKPQSVDSGNCDDLISFLNGDDNAWDLNSLPAGQHIVQEPISSGVMSMSELDERFQLVDNFCRRELGLGYGAE